MKKKYVIATSTSVKCKYVNPDGYFSVMRVFVGVRGWDKSLNATFSTVRGKQVNLDRMYSI